MKLRSGTEVVMAQRNGSFLGVIPSTPGRSTRLEAPTMEDRTSEQASNELLIATCTNQSTSTNSTSTVTMSAPNTAVTVSQAGASGTCTTTSKPTVKLAKFDGKTMAARQWWALFIHYVTYLCMSEQTALSNFAFHLEGVAFQWYFHQLADTAKSSLSTLKDAFFKRFSADKSIFDVNILQVKQSVSETVDDYVARIYTQTSDYNIPEEMLVGIAIQGLHAPLARIVMPQKPTNMEQFREFALLAQKTEKATCLPQESITAAISGLEERLMSNLTSRFEASISAVTANNANQKFTPQSQRPQFSNYRAPNFGHVRNHRFQNNPYGNQQRYPSPSRFPQYRPRFQGPPSTPQFSCPGCGGQCTVRTQCSAFGQQCRKCGKMNHFKRVCRSQ